MENQKEDFTLQQETEHLQKIIEIAQKERQSVLHSIATMEEEMEDEKKEARENITYGIRDMSNPDDFEAFVELSQSMSHVDKMVSDYDEYKRRVKMLDTLIQKPYFARIDFLFEDGDTEKIYIGRRALSDRITKEICIYDWRAPISGVFYRFMTGPAYYDAPCGRIDGKLTLKRQFEIKDCTLKYFFDSDRAINDEILRRLLSQNTSPKMKAIVETIQGDQDVVIRDMENDLLMVQGVAGSGKTSIALHRAAYLIYQGTQFGLKADHILILSPNTTFEDYISGVLPELGEDNIASTTFDVLLNNTLKERTIQPRHEYLEQVLSSENKDSLTKKSMQLKTSDHFLELFYFYLENLPEYGITYQDIYHHGKCIITAKQLKEQLKKRPYVPLGTRLNQLQNFILELAYGTGKKHGLGEEYIAFTQKLQEMFTLDPIQIYRSFLTNESIYEELLTEVDSEEVLDEILKITMDTLEYGTLPYEDAMILTYLSLKFTQKGVARHIRQVVIDEAQDYSPIQFEILSLLYPTAKFTVLGDINQTLDSHRDASFYKMVPQRLHKDKFSLVTLNKSFRCTNEILQYSLHFLEKMPEIECFNRLGTSPQIFLSHSKEEHIGRILDEIQHCKDRGYTSVCLLCKSGQSASALQYAINQYLEDKGPDAFASSLRPKLIIDTTDEELTGVLTMPVYLSKGLEFDAVLICDADAASYHTQNDKRLLYISCTRALHHLSIFCEKEPCPFL